MSHWGDACGRIASIAAEFAHNCIAHPLLFWTRQAAWAVWLHDWTAAVAWSSDATVGATATNQGDNMADVSADRPDQEVSTGTKLAAYWDWPAGAEVPDARIVVCAPGVMTDKARVLMWVEYERGRAFVLDVESDPPRGLHFYHGLNVRTQADLARLSAVLPMSVKRRALVVSPEEAIDLDPLVCEEHGEAEIVNGDDGATPFCAECPGGEEATEMGSAGYLDGIDVVFIVGTNKPMHPEWVRSIVEQCRKAGVLCVFLGWGEWVPTSQRDPQLSTDAAQPAVGCMKFIENEAFLCVGAEQSGALLDGKPVEDVPAWLGGTHG